MRRVDDLLRDIVDDLAMKGDLSSCVTPDDVLKEPQNYEQLLDELISRIVAASEQQQQDPEPVGIGTLMASNPLLLCDGYKVCLYESFGQSSPAFSVSARVHHAAEASGRYLPKFGSELRIQQGSDVIQYD